MERKLYYILEHRFGEPRVRRVSEPFVNKKKAENELNWFKENKQEKGKNFFNEEITINFFTLEEDWLYNLENYN